MDRPPRSKCSLAPPKNMELSKLPFFAFLLEHAFLLRLASYLGKMVKKTYFCPRRRLRKEVGRKYGKFFHRQPVESHEPFPTGRFLKKN